jgi:hypothetical protein
MPSTTQRPIVEDGEAEPVKPTVEDVWACQFSRWYKTFRSLPIESFSRKAVTIKSVILPLPDDFIDYLKTDGVQLPVEAVKLSSCTPDHIEDDEWGDDNVEEPNPYSFPLLTEQIASAIESLGGAVMPKLNWSCPKDATWINSGTLKCQTPGDIYVLLKSSDFVVHDLLHAFDNVVGEKPTNFAFQLVLRQWCNLHPSMEFRCFVWNGDLVAISQRNHTQYFRHVVTEKMIFRSLILDFFDEFVHENFSERDNYCFDVYVDKNERPWLLDFNVWGTQTDSLLFSWQELSTLTTAYESVEDILETNVKPEIRVVEIQNEVKPDPLASYRAPIDTVDLAYMTASDKSKFEEFMKLCKKPTEKTDDK